MNTHNTDTPPTLPALDVNIDVDTFVLATLHAVTPQGITEKHLGSMARTRLNKGVTDAMLSAVLRELADKVLVTSSTPALGPRHWHITPKGTGALEEAGLVETAAA